MPLLVLLALILLASPLAAQPRASERPSLVLVSIDGLRPEYVLAADSLGLRVPNLRRFVGEGSWASGVRGVIPTVTYPSHTTLVTGVWPARHGILDNNTFDPQQRNQSGWYWYAQDIRVPTLWDAAREAGIRTANVHWPVTVGAAIDLNIPQIWRTGMPDDRKLVRALSTPGLIDGLEKELGPYADGIDETLPGDVTRARFAARLIERERPGFALVYLTALDHVQHATGPFSSESRATIERIDSLVGDIAGAADRISHGHAVIAVVSDHGFVRTDSSVNLGAAFRRAGLLDVGADGKPSTWRAIPWGAGATAAIVLADHADAAARTRALALVDSLARDPSSGIAQVLDDSMLHARGGFPDAIALVALRPRFVLGGSLDGPLTSPVSVGGTHGYLPTVDEMRSVFFIRGAGVSRGRALGEIDMRDIAPTLASLMRVSLPTAEGKALRVTP